MQTKNKRSKFLTNRLKIRTTLVLNVIVILASLISATFGFANFLTASKEWDKVVILGFAVVCFSLGFMAILAPQERVAKLKDKLVSTYLNAVDNSPLNPFRGPRRQ